MRGKNEREIPLALYIRLGCSKIIQGCAGLEAVRETNLLGNMNSCDIGSENMVQRHLDFWFQ